MWFKNLQVYRLASFNFDHAQLDEKLRPLMFQPTNSLEKQRFGWVAPCGGEELVHSVGGHYLLAFRSEKKLLPASVITQVARERAQEIEEQQGYKPGRKQMREIKEAVTDELLPRAFSVWRDTRIWIDPAKERLVIDAGSLTRCDEVMQLLSKSLEGVGCQLLQTLQTPVGAMTAWLADDEAPYGFTIDQEAELQSPTQSKATVRYVRHTVDAEDVQRHIEQGKQCTRLALTWADRVSFVLTDSFALKRIAPLDVIQESMDGTAADEAERFDNDFTLMTGELSQMLDALIAALGGEKPEAAATQAA